MYGISMQHYHMDTEGIPKYINTIKYAQKQSRRAGKPITVYILLLIAMNAILLTESFCQA